MIDAVAVNSFLQSCKLKCVDNINPAMHHLVRLVQYKVLNIEDNLSAEFKKIGHEDVQKDTNIVRDLGISSVVTFG